MDPKRTLSALALAFVAVQAQALVTLHWVGIECMDVKAVLLEADQARLVCVRPLPETRAYLLAIGPLDQFLREVFEVLLWRQPDGPGLAYWTAEISSGRRSREYVINAIIDSPEYAAVRK